MPFFGYGVFAAKGCSRAAAGLAASQGGGELFDQPHVVAEAGPVLKAVGVAARCEVVGGDFFTAVPAGADAYILRYVVHD